VSPVVLVYAHPHPDRSVAGQRLVQAARQLDGVAVHSLYDRYPDFEIDVSAERAALTAARLVVWQHPLYWYSAPALLKLWFEQVLGVGWAYGTGGTALAGKHCLWATTTGALEAAYSAQGEHGHPFAAFEPVMKQTARFCGMQWLEPIVVHGAHRIDAARLQAAAQAYRDRIAPFAAPLPTPVAAPVATPVTTPVATSVATHG
jgi:glutathione-regulated potassium-efflux system ancillary protein KefF